MTVTMKQVESKRGGLRPGAGRPKGRGPHGEPTKPMRVPMSKVDSVIAIINSEITGGNETIALPLYSSYVQAGFPSPADDHMEAKIDLNQYLVKHPSATFLLKAAGESMIGAGIFPGDILVVDRSIEATDGKVIIAAVDGQLTVKRLSRAQGKVRLLPENDAFPEIEINDGTELNIFGVVTNVIHKL